MNNITLLLPAALWIGFILDLLLGDPVRLYHPVRWIGKEISGLERVLRSVFPRSERGERCAGAVMAVLLMATGFAVPFLILWICFHIHWTAGLAAQGWLCYRMLAVRSLRDESMPVKSRLDAHDLPGAREAVSRIVGRDTAELDTEGVAKAAVETVAENAADGVVAPMFYMMLFGAVGGFVYKAVNTMDSMVGYRNDRYRCFGTAAARIDDVLNFIPARICALLIILCSWGASYDRKRALRIWRRDRRRHKSPNSAQSEAAMAGALGLELAGNASYFGRMTEKETIGDRTRPIEAEDIAQANRMLYRIAWMMMLLFTILRAAVFLFHQGI